MTADIDHFKRVNDSAGHATGDEILQALAILLTEGVRQIDSVARIGGEEFAILVPDTDAEGAYVLAERLRGQVQVVFGDRLQPITMSFGIAAFPADGAGAGELLRAADNALYAAKRLGRNQAVRYARTVPAAAATARAVDRSPPAQSSLRSVPQGAVTIPTPRSATSVIRREALRARRRKRLRVDARRARRQALRAGELPPQRGDAGDMRATPCSSRSSRAARRRARPT